MDRVALDTTFLIDLQNERRGRGRKRGALSFLKTHQATELLLPSVVLGEYLEGFADPDSNEAQAVVSILRVLDVTNTVARVYSQVARSLRLSGQLIGANDLWIACTALAAQVPVVTRNVEHFARIPKLNVIAYT